jgi:4'-phosphopantetheinyl transferase
MVQTGQTTPTIYPVILQVPADKQVDLPPRQRVLFLSRHARQALSLSAERLGVELGALQKDPRGAPLPFKDHFWSLTHKPKYVGAVVSPVQVGIDLEQVRPCSEALFRKTASAEEWSLTVEEDRLLAFFRFWTAKEAVLKTGGEGIKDLSRCRIVRIESSAHLLVDYAGQTWPVEQFFFDGHVASVAISGCRLEI